MDNHITFGDPPYGGKPCGHYYSHQVAYYEEQLYGCCAAWSLPIRGKGIPLTTDWRSQLNDIVLPCENCCLSTSEQEPTRFVKNPS